MPAQRHGEATRYMRRQALLVAAFNGVMNFGYTAWQWRQADEVPFVGDGGAAMDLSLTAAIIGLLSTLLGTAGARAKLRQLPAVLGAPRWLHRLPANLVLRSLAIAAIAGVVMGAPVALSMLALDGVALPPLAMSAIKLGLSIAISLVVVRWVVRAASADVQARSSRQASNREPALGAPRTRAPSPT
jgi:hypothetical protein